jgi:hypothetical protein
MLEFPTFEEAKAWYSNPAYQAASAHRFKGADYRTIVIDGVPTKQRCWPVSMVGGRSEN